MPSPTQSRRSLILTSINVLIICLLLGTCSAVARRKLHKAKVDRVPNYYFVHFWPENNRSTIQGVVDELEKLNQDTSHPNFTVTVQRVLREVANGLAVKLSNEALQYLLEHDAVHFVEEDSYVHSGQLSDNYPQFVNARTVTSWGIDRMDQTTNSYNSLYSAPCELTGRGVDVYILDSGIRYNHVQFGGRAMYPGCDIVDDVYNSSTPYEGNDCFGHGTKVAGIIGGSSNGVAPGANLFSVRVLNCKNTGSWNTILAGLECILNKITQRQDRSAVVNMSIYGANKNRAIKSAIDKLIDMGVAVVSLSGNSDNDKSGNACKVAPASIPGVITVAGSTREDEAYNRTKMGRCVDLLAPAKDLISVSHNCRTCSATRLAGSSFAAPHVTGAIALLLEKCPKLPQWKIKYYLLTKMVLPHKLTTESIIPKKYQYATPNLLIHTGPEMCSIEC